MYNQDPEADAAERGSEERWVGSRRESGFTNGHSTIKSRSGAFIRDVLGSFGGLCMLDGRLLPLDQPPFTVG